ncbi:MAG: Rho termination factor N-terminal domain-containing protein, partial [Propionicimonas sp.]
MTDTLNPTSAAGSRPQGIDKMLLPELKQLASSLGIKGASGLRKPALVEAIKAAGGSGAASAPTRSRRRADDAPKSNDHSAEPEVQRAETPRGDAARTERREAPAEPMLPSSPEGGDDVASRLEALRAEGGRNRRRQGQQGDRQQGDRQQGQQGDRPAPDRQQGDRAERQDADAVVESPRQPRLDRDSAEDDFGSGRRGRRRRNRDRQNRRGNNRSGGSLGMERMEAEPTVSEDDVVVDISGILDVLDNYAFVRTTGYLPGTNDVYVSLSMVRK